VRDDHRKRVQRARRADGTGFRSSSRRLLHKAQASRLDPFQVGSRGRWS
jgi:hypothetical protein